MRSMVPPTVRRLAATAFAALLVFLVAAPVLAYNEENVANINLRRLDPISCKQTFRIRARLTDADGNPVPGAEVRFSFKEKKRGDDLGPSVVFSNANGRATTVVNLSCRGGERVIRARVPGDGRALITINCRLRHGCAAEEGVAPIEGIAPGPGGSGAGDIILPATDRISEDAGSVVPWPARPSPILNLVGLITIAAFVAGLVGQRKAARRRTFGLAPE
jgi:hypothetical protein